MTSFDIDKTARAQGRSAIVIAAPIQKVWTRLSDIEAWPEWNTAVEWMGAPVPLTPGAGFEWRAGGVTIRSRLQAVEAPRLIGWTGQAPFVSARHVTWLEETGSATRVTTAESFRGAYAWLFPRHAGRQIEAALAQGLSDLKAACEGTVVRKTSRRRSFEDIAA